jgi:hypothetical protein
MKHFVMRVFLFITICTGWNTVKAQKIENFQLQPRRVKINSSIFSTVKVIDTRLNAAHLGFVQRGGLNRKALITLNQPLNDELASVVLKMIDSANKQAGTLFINIREFFIQEFNGKGGENGKFTFKANCYFSRDSIYRPMFSIDTSITVVSLWDVTDKLLDTVPELLGKIIQQAAAFETTLSDATRGFSAYDIEHIDLIEKKEIPVYNVELPEKGLYATYEDFKNNRPSREDVIIQTKKGFSRPLVYEMKENGKKGKEILHKYYYAVCDGEKAFISGPYNIYLLTKRNNDFYFTGVGKDASDAGTVVLATVLMGVVGGIAAANNDLAVFEFKIDYNTGKFLPVKKIKD